MLTGARFFFFWGAHKFKIKNRHNYNVAHMKGNRPPMDEKLGMVGGSRAFSPANLPVILHWPLQGAEVGQATAGMAKKVPRMHPTCTTAARFKDEWRVPHTEVAVAAVTAAVMQRATVLAASTLSTKTGKQSQTKLAKREYEVLSCTPMHA